MFDLVWWLAATALAAGCLIQTALGFGMAVLAAPIIVVLRPEWVPVVLTVTALVLSVMNVWHLRRDIQLRVMLAPFITRIPGTLLGAWILVHLPVQALQILVAAAVLLAVLVSALGRAFEATPARLGWAGFISGIMGTTTSIGGPPMALVMQHGQARTTRANLALYFGYSCVLSLLSYQFAGLLSPRLWLESLSFVPAALLGFALGRLCQNWVDNRFRPLLLILCSVSAGLALSGALFAHG
ncbi:sulfite exporter TauE/SafE family protein [Saccharospirillum mangrovi]|uniref:sulfite exporter TauE/SafE family protein n=1 Tax=Saccharospirillum mangrovi TaxID=2161747 RepID=UPI000D3C672D|nr:sulfite exporter TauE/SafE family protein [Saccharospirillum mangrovi]